MKLLRDDRRMINYEGFHVFKVRLSGQCSIEMLANMVWQVFVANPNKSVAVQRILISNRDKLLRFLPTFLEDRTEDDQFIDEKSFLIRQIEQLPPAPIPPPAWGYQSIFLFVHLFRIGGVWEDSFRLPIKHISQRHRRFPLACMHVDFLSEGPCAQRSLGTEKVNLVIQRCVVLDSYMYCPETLSGWVVVVTHNTKLTGDR